MTSAGLGQEPIWETERAAMTRVLSEILAPTAPHRLPVREAALTAGLVVLADWLVSQTRFVRAQLPRVPASGDVASLRAFFEGSLEPTADVVQRAGLSRLQLLPGNFGEEFPGLSPNTLQEDIASQLPRAATGPGLLMIAAPMGFGKTETALHAGRIMGEAAGTSGMFVALPTMATADQMFGRVAR